MTELAMQSGFVVRRRHAGKHAKRPLRNNSALAAVAAPAGTFPGVAMPEPAGTRERLVSGGL